VESATEIVSKDKHLFANFLLLGLYDWLASRRSLEPLRHLAARLTVFADLEWFPPEVLASAGPREAVARLSESERALIRAILKQHGDRRGFEFFALDAKRSDG
jgi:hypothetical protein